jgi:hypothetical protein
MIIIDKSFYIVKATSNRGRGLFARKQTPAGTILADYLGKVISPEDDIESNHGGLYGLCWRDDFCILPDVISQNGAHLINHSCMPNTTLYPYKGHILFVTTRNVFPNEEFTVSYVIEPDVCEDSICNHACFCGTPLCKGTMHASEKTCKLFWDDFIYKKMGKHYHAKFEIGSRITRLASYPKTFPDHHLIPVYGTLKKPALIYKSNNFPDRKILRELIRTTGKTIKVNNSRQIILGLTSDNHIISRFGNLKTSD